MEFFSDRIDKIFRIEWRISVPYPVHPVNPVKKTCALNSTMFLKDNTLLPPN
jgi:hypothetical protein